jgi:hypothetical protein
MVMLNVLVTYTPKEALSVYTEAHKTKSQYIKIQSHAKMKNCNIYPSYHVIKVAEEECYLSKNKTLIQDCLLEMDLQALMDKTASIIIMAQKMPQILFWMIFRKNMFQFQNEVAMEVLDIANTSSSHWKTLVKVIFLSHQ